MDGHRDIVVLDTAEDICRFMIGKWKEIAQGALEERGYFAAALSGGKTPVDFFKGLSALGGTFPWERTHIFVVDERFVLLTHPDSNYGLVTALFLDSVGIPRQNCHPVPVDEPSPELSARKYEEDIKTFFRLSKGEFPRFDLIHLGIGEDGHTASLFPGSSAVQEKSRLVVGTVPKNMRHDRITLTLPVINNGRNVVFLVQGKGKAGVLKRVILGESSLPATLVRPGKGKLFFVADRAAGELLTAEEIVGLGS
jgi:6-phosphogluconolactonase